MEKELKIITRTELEKMITAQDVHNRCKAFICPMCDTVQSMASLVDAGCSTDMVHEYIGYSCEGRWRGGGSPLDKTLKKTQKQKIRGCNWTLGGLFKTHKLEIIEEGEENHPFFMPASPEQAKELANLYPPTIKE